MSENPIIGMKEQQRRRARINRMKMTIIFSIFGLSVRWFCCKKADDELPAIKQALRELIAEIEVDCGK